MDSANRSKISSKYFAVGRVQLWAALEVEGG
jgi:hypothetical protein